MSGGVIFFDVHDTLIAKGGEEAAAAARREAVDFLKKRGYEEVTYEQYTQSWRRGIKSCLELYKTYREIEFFQWYGMILDGLGIANRKESFIYDLNAAYMKGFEPYTKVFSHVPEVLEELQQVYRLAVISNSLGVNTRIDLQVTGLSNYFEEIFISSDIGWRKPHPYIYECACNKMRIDPDKAIFVGNDLREDIEGALAKGMQPVVIDHYQTCPDIVEIALAGEEQRKVLLKVVRDFLEVREVIRNIEVVKGYVISSQEGKR